MSTKKSSTDVDRVRFPVDPWGLVETAPDAADAGLMGTLFAIGNGYLGMRADFAPDPQSSGTYINGFHETYPIQHAEQAYGLARTGQTVLDVPDTKSIELRVDDEPLRLDPAHQDAARIRDYSRHVDFRAGVLHSEYIWTTGAGASVRIESDRLVSLAHRHLAAIRLTVTILDSDATVTLASQLVNRQDIAATQTGTVNHDPRRGRSFDHRVLEPGLSRHDEPDGAVILGFRAARSGMTIAAGYRHHIDSVVEAVGETELSDDRATTTITLDVATGETITLTKFAAYHTAGQVDDGLDVATVDELGERCAITLAEAATTGWDALVDSQRAWLDEFWARTDIEIEGDPPAQQAIRWNLFQLAQASAQIGERGIAAKAVTAPGYEGHYFWDTEVYVLPLLASTNPGLALQLLRYRHRILPLARQRAEEMSQRGALYPWRTINGEEASGYYPAGTAQYHIDADVAYAIERYVTATGDEDFVAEQGAEILVELARLFADLGFYDHADPPVFHIHGVTGPDEYTAVVDDNLYTNVMARFTMRYAADTVTRLRRSRPDAHAALTALTLVDDDEIAGWRRAADSMCVLYDEERGVNPQDDAFLGHEPWDWEGTPPEKYPLLLNFHSLVIYRHQVLKQADVVLAMFIRGDDFAPDLQRRNFDFYDPITTGDSSLSACVQSIAASQVGHPDLAWHYFDQSLYLDIADTHGNTVDGAHIANVGGVWGALVHGFAGVRDNGERLRVAPRLPTQWSAMRFRLQRRGSDIGFELDAGGATVTVASGDPVPVEVDGELRLVPAGGSIRIASAADAG